MKRTIKTQRLMDDIYGKIEYNQNSYNSISLGIIFGVKPDDIRVCIREINLDLSKYEFGIVSVDKKYRLAKTLEDITKKKTHYIRQHRHNTSMEKLWETREFNVLGDKVQKELDEYEYKRINQNQMENDTMIITAPKHTIDVLENLANKSKKLKEYDDKAEEYAEMNLIKGWTYGLVDDGKYATYDELVEYWKENNGK